MGASRQLRRAGRGGRQPWGAARTATRQWQPQSEPSRDLIDPRQPSPHPPLSTQDEKQLRDKKKTLPTCTSEKGRAKSASSVPATTRPFRREVTPARPLKIVWLKM